ncbi:MAG: hypothetical protein HQ477_07810 [Chloroflexi bacterium]|jgi:hypothetical protein|nr:hypothetical protein [Chloroflexota bacterium]
MPESTALEAWIFAAIFAGLSGVNAWTAMSRGSVPTKVGGYVFSLAGWFVAGAILWMHYSN